MSQPITSAFTPDEAGLHHAVDLVVGLANPATDPAATQAGADLPRLMPEVGLGPSEALQALFRPVLAAGRDLSAPGFFAHMDPPTPWITWAMSLWTARMNQNLLHPDTAPTARELEQLVISWLAPHFAMTGGHLVPGSTVANLTAIWAARELGAVDVVAGPNAHISVAKAAKLLGMPMRTLDPAADADLSQSVAVITAGTTSTGEIESLDTAAGARWRHVDAAWAGPLRLSRTHGYLLDGIETADSVSISAHKWLFQPKESAAVLFADTEQAHAAISAGGAYLAVPNVGLLGSHGAAAVPLLATLLAYGRTGIEAWIDRSMGLADELHGLIEDAVDFEARSVPMAGVICWRHHQISPAAIKANLSNNVMVSTTTVDGVGWLRSVAANPLAEPSAVIEGVRQAAEAATAKG